MFGLPPAEALYHGNPIDFRMLCFIAAGCFFAGLGTAWPTVRKKFPQQALVLSVGRMASDARYWLVVFLAGFLYAAAPEIYRRATTPVAVTGAIGVMPIGSALLEDAIKAATAKIREERDSGLLNLARVSKERDDLAQQLQQSRKSSSPTTSYDRKMGPIAVLNAFSESGAIWRKVVPANTGILITADSENRELASNLSNIFQVGMREVSDKLKPGQPWLLQPPDYSVDIDAPRLPSSGYSGVVIHGSGDGQSELRAFLDRCFITRQTPKTTDGLASYYKLDNVLWIEIGPGSPWKPDPTICSG
jgi:hypothetical protein